MFSEPSCQHALRIKDVMSAIQDLTLELHGTQQNLDALAAHMEQSREPDGQTICFNSGPRGWNPITEQDLEYTTWFHKVAGFRHDVWMSIIDQAREERSHDPIETFEPAKEDINPIVSNNATGVIRCNSSPKYDLLEDVLDVVSNTSLAVLPDIILDVVPTDDVHDDGLHRDTSTQATSFPTNAFFYGCTTKFELPKGEVVVICNSSGASNGDTIFIMLDGCSSSFYTGDTFGPRKSLNAPMIKVFDPEGGMLHYVFNFSPFFIGSPT